MQWDTIQPWEEWNEGENGTEWSNPGLARQALHRCAVGIYEGLQKHRGDEQCHWMLEVKRWEFAEGHKTTMRQGK